MHSINYYDEGDERERSEHSAIHISNKTTQNLLRSVWGFCACANDECAVGMGKLFPHCVFGAWTKYLRLGIESGIICSCEWRLARAEESESIEEISTPVRLSSEWPGPGHLITGHTQHWYATFFIFFAAILNFPGPTSSSVVSVCCGYYFRYYDNARDAMMQFRKLQNTCDIIISQPHREVRARVSVKL